MVIGRRARRVGVDEAAACVFGCTVACDITARDLQKKDGQWTRAKGMDTFCPVGPVVVTGLDPQALAIACRVNGELRQSGSTADMIFSVAAVIAYASQVMTLEPGDLLVTGTPPGVGPLHDGDALEIEVPGIGTLRARASRRAARETDRSRCRVAALGVAAALALVGRAWSRSPARAPSRRRAARAGWSRWARAAAARGSASTGDRCAGRADAGAPPGMDVDAPAAASRAPRVVRIEGGAAPRRARATGRRRAWSRPTRSRWRPSGSTRSR